MNYSEIDTAIDDIAERCTSSEEVLEEVKKMSEAEQMMVIHHAAKDSFFNGTKDYAVRTIEFLDKYQIINDYETGTGRREPMTGILRAISTIYLQSTNDQGRTELQVQDETTQHAVELVNYASDLAIELDRITQEIIRTEMEYNAVLSGRRYGCEFQNSEGEYVHQVGK